MTTAYGYHWRQLCIVARCTYPWTCHICHTSIEDGLPSTHPDSWTLDHLDPIVTHGNTVPTIDRTRPAHRRCNSKRGGLPLVESPRTRDW